MVVWRIVYVSFLWTQVSALISLSVLSPASLRTAFPAGIQGKPALFGTLPYGSYVAGKLLSTGSSCCSSCSPLNFNSSMPSIFLIPYGTCSPDSKVYSAQQAGAKAVLLYNVFGRLEFDAMAPSGSYAVSIPSVLIGSTTYRQIVQTEGDVYLNMTLDLGSVGLPVPIGMGFALARELDYQLEGLLSVLSTFDMANVDYTPYYLIPQCFNCRLPPDFPDCMFNGRYCSLEHPHGALVLQEVIRQNCIYAASLNQSSYSIYANYMEVWFSQCLSHPESLCTAGFDAAGINASDVQACYNSSFVYGRNTSEPVDNSDLRMLQAAIYSMSNVTLLPSLVVGREMVYGDLSVETWNRAICSVLGNESHPACAKYFCAPGCWKDQLGNQLCDVSCNVEACDFDKNACESPLHLPPPVPIRPPVLNNTTPSVPTNSTTPTVPLGSYNSTSPLNNSTSISNSTQTSSNVTYPNSDSNPSNHSNAWQCSVGCDQLSFISSKCHPACNVSDCSYQNWTCACAFGCSPDMLVNDFCNSACNTQSCNYDNGYCPRITMPLSFPVYMDESGRESEELPSWKKWVIISLSVFGFRYLLCSFICVVLILCYRRMKKPRSHAHRPSDDFSLNQLNQSVVPMSDGVEVLNADKIISALGGRLFVPEILEYADAVCVVCLSE